MASIELYSEQSKVIGNLQIMMFKGLMGCIFLLMALGIGS
jgi:hypothetical protein